MKRITHIAIIAVFIILTYFLYNDGLGAIPFLLAAFYLCMIILKELKSLRRSKRL